MALVPVRPGPGVAGPDQALAPRQGVGQPAVEPVALRPAQHHLDPVALAVAQLQQVRVGEVVVEDAEQVGELQPLVKAGHVQRQRVAERLLDAPASPACEVWVPKVPRPKLSNPGTATGRLAVWEKRPTCAFSQVSPHGRNRSRQPRARLDQRVLLHVLALEEDVGAEARA